MRGGASTGVAPRRLLWQVHGVLVNHGKEAAPGTLRNIRDALESCLGKGWVKYDVHRARGARRGRVVGGLHPELPGALTQARRLDHVEDFAREAIDLAISVLYRSASKTAGHRLA